ncbi:MAG TPA: leucyl aminopeptidase [Gaiellales bacterium]|jgi:leucyl aminopeptidase
MRITTTNSSALRVAADVLVVAVAKPPKLEGTAAEIDSALGGVIQGLIDAGEIRGIRGRVTVVHAPAGARARRVAVVGLGASPQADDVRMAAAVCARTAMTARAESIAFVVDSVPLERDLASRCLTEGALLGEYRFDRYRSDPAGEQPGRLDSAALVGGDRRSAQRASVVATAVNRARDLQNTPSNDLGPQQLAERALAIEGEHPTVTAKVHDRRFLERRGMGAFLAVAAAGGPAPALITLRHKPSKKPRGDVVLGLVGKGLTFDTGGLSLKPARSMTGMKFDMSGAAAVLEATAAIAALDLPIKVVTVVGAVENLVSPSGMRPDDVVRAANGKTIEITNTDAEGRLVLADCLHHARTLGATHVVDLATLTGAIVVALGDWHAGVYGRDEEFVDRIRTAGETGGEHIWQMPLHDTYKRFMRSEVADMQNASTAGKGGAGMAARFLQEFAGEGPWAHVDIAGVADIDTDRGDGLGKGGSGWGVRMLVELAQSLC